MKNIFSTWNEDIACCEARSCFTIVRREGVDYIYYNGVRITNEEDAKNNLLDRLEYLRETYIHEKLKKIK